MTATDHSTDRNTPREQALHWFSKARLGSLTSDEQKELDAWLARDPAHEREYWSSARSICPCIPTAWR
ncbi:FecR/PupR family sigma factor regulator [Paracandidimonas soli]